MSGFRPTLPFAAAVLLAAPIRQPAPHAVGTVRFATSCGPAARPIFNRGVALLHSFAFSLANDQFTAALRADSGCAMAWWGLALSAWGNPFAAGIKPPAQIARGLEATSRARAAGPPTDRESRYIEAVARLYQGADSVRQRARVLAYRDAMTDLVSREPADTEAVIFHALALVISADPADKTYANQLAAGAILERLFAKMPDHPGLAHYIIHSYDVPPLANRALAAAGRYGRIAPEVSHALHMPSHTYTRVGDWQRSIDANVASAGAARREGAVAEELHAADYRTYAYLQMGRDRAAARIVTELTDLASRLDPNAVGTGAPPAAGYFAIAAIPARYALERGAWAEAVQLPLHPSPVPFADAVTWFARGLGGARSGDSATADSAVAALDRLGDRLAAAGEGYWVEQVGIQRSEVAAWRSFAVGRTADALADMRKAVDREDATEKNAITPGPLAPAHELLGEMLLEANRPQAALAEFEESMRREPKRFRTLAGAVKAARAAGNPVSTRRYAAVMLKLGLRPSAR